MVVTSFDTFEDGQNKTARPFNYIINDDCHIFSKFLDAIMLCDAMQSYLIVIITFPLIYTYITYIHDTYNMHLTCLTSIH